MPITAAARCLGVGLDRSNTGIAGSNRTRRMNVGVYLCCAV
jgi:hypothetical protein